MKITNFPKHILLYLFNNDYIGADYVIYKLDLSGCKVKIVSSGILNNEMTTLTLPDGNYRIYIHKDSYVDIVEDFIVYYNFLCDFVKKFLDLICCECCNGAGGKEEYNSKLDELFFETFLGFQCLGVLDTLKLTRKLSCDNKEELLEKNKISQFYGGFEFDYTEKKKILLQAMYIDFYKNSINSIKRDNNDIEAINSLFQIEKVEKCLYKNKIDFSYFSELYDKLNCKKYE